LLNSFDLPPNQVAKPLPVTSKSRKNDPRKKVTKDEGTHPKRKREATVKDDAPRAFKRLMAFAGGKRPRSGLDDGVMPKKKSRKQKQKPESDTEAAPEAPVPTPKAPEALKIRPGERMSEFAARVDAALPISGLINKSERNGKDPLGLKIRRTNKERKMHKLYDQWHEEERKIQEQREEELERQAEEELEDEETGVSWKLNMEAAGGSASGTNKKKKKKGKRSRLLGEAAEPEKDPWEELRKKRGEAKIGLNDVAKAPPELHMQMSKKLTVRGAAVHVDGVPKAAGSLRRREELQGAREDVIASYRRLMESKRPGLIQ
jgi:hypothetical protein